METTDLSVIIYSLDHMTLPCSADRVSQNTTTLSHNACDSALFPLAILLVAKTDGFYLS